MANDNTNFSFPIAKLWAECVCVCFQWLKYKALNWLNIYRPNDNRCRCWPIYSNLMTNGGVLSLNPVYILQTPPSFYLSSLFLSHYPFSSVFFSSFPLSVHIKCLQNEDFSLWLVFFSFYLTKPTRFGAFFLSNFLVFFSVFRLFVSFRRTNEEYYQIVVTVKREKLADDG